MKRCKLLRQLISGKDNEAKVDDSLGTNHLVAFCDVEQVPFEARFNLSLLPQVQMKTTLDVPVSSEKRDSKTM